MREVWPPTISDQRSLSLPFYAVVEVLKPDGNDEIWGFVALKSPAYMRMPRALSWKPGGGANVGTSTPRQLLEGLQARA